MNKPVADESPFLAYGITVALALLATLWLSAILLQNNAPLFVTDEGAHSSTRSGKMVIRTISLMSNSPDTPATTNTSTNSQTDLTTSTQNNTSSIAPTTPSTNSAAPTEVAAQQPTVSNQQNGGESNQITRSTISNASSEGGESGTTTTATTSSTSDNAIQATACDVMPRFVVAKKPIYPEQARRAGMSGKVYVNVLLSEEGRPIKAMVVKRQPTECTLFDAVALKAVMESRYSPGIQNGKAVKVWLTVPMRFELK
uniref:Outer membrane transport energization protein TonB n=1 Tax=Chlorobium chlorochromatii (strain CaD3) TaxID=340177 RepID=Q3AT50_CHLCH